jgi:hypothetical protein
MVRRRSSRPPPDRALVILTLDPGLHHPSTEMYEEAL